MKYDNDLRQHGYVGGGYSICGGEIVESFGLLNQLLQDDMAFDSMETLHGMKYEKSKSKIIAWRYCHYSINNLHLYDSLSAELILLHYYEFQRRRLKGELLKEKAFLPLFVCV